MGKISTSHSRWRLRPKHMPENVGDCWITIGKVSTWFVSFRSRRGQSTYSPSCRIRSMTLSWCLRAKERMLAERRRSKISIFPEVPKLPKERYGATRSNKECHQSSSIHCSSRSLLGNRALRCGAVPCSLGPAPGREVESLRDKQSIGK